MSLSLEHKEALVNLLGQESITRSALAAALCEEAEEWRRRVVNTALDQSKSWEQRRDTISESAAKAKYAEGLIVSLLNRASK